MGNLPPVNPRTSHRSWLNTPDPGDKMLLIYQWSTYRPAWYCHVCTAFLLFESSKPTPRILPAKAAKEGALLLCGVSVLFNFPFLQHKFRRSCCPVQLNLLPATGGWRSVQPTQRPATDVNFTPIFIFHSVLSQILPGWSKLVSNSMVYFYGLFFFFYSCHIVS